MIDWDRVKSLRDELGEDDFLTVVELFLDEIEGTVMRLGTDDAVRLESDLHFLRGSALNLGFAAFGAACYDAEQIVRQGCAQSVSISGLLDSYAEHKKEFLTGHANAAQYQAADPQSGVAGCVTPGIETATRHG